MRLSAAERQAIILDLTTNSETWLANGDDRVLSAFTDDKLVALKTAHEKERQAITVANNAVNGFTDPTTGTAYRVNPVTGKWEMATNAMPDNFKKKKKDPEEDEEDEEEEDDETTNATPPPAKSKNSKVPAREERPIRSIDDFIRTAPPAIREQMENTLNAARAVEQREKDTIIAKLLVNVADTERESQYNRLQHRTLEELNNDLSLIPKMPTAEQATQRLRGKRPVRNNDVDNDMLGMPTMNWEEVRDGKPNITDAVNNGRQTNNRDEDEYDDPRGDEDAMRNLPSHLRATVANAMQIEARERNNLINEIVSNSTIADDATERRMIARLEKKPLDELRDMLAMLPTKQKPRPNYFGQSNGVNNNNNSVRIVANDVNEDVLLPPKMDWKDISKNTA